MHPRIFAFLTIRPQLLRLALCLLVGLAIYGPERAAPPVMAAGGIVVSSTSLADDDKDGVCTLREALQAAFNQHATGQASVHYHECTASAGPNTITFDGGAAGGVITLGMGENPLPMITKGIIIIGPVIISGAGMPAQPDPDGKFQDSRLFRVTGDGVLTLMDLTLKSGYTSGFGGAVLGDSNNGAINLTRVAMVDNTALGDGGAIHAAGTVNITMSTFAGNRAMGYNPDFSTNPVTGAGGALMITGAASKLMLTQSQFSANIASKSGGALFNNSATVTVADVAFNGNIANAAGGTGQGGGAIFNASNATLKLERTVFNGNLTPVGSGGALYNNLSAASVTIIESAFNGNIAGNLGADGRGGAIYNEEDMQITRATFNGNIAAKEGLGGAILNNRAAVLKLTNSSFFANSAAQGKGGALANIDTPFPVSSDSTLELRNVTVSGNIASSGGAIYNEERVALWNTIIEEGTTGKGGVCAGAKTPENMGHNLQHPGSSCGASITSSDPKLDLPKFNGGGIVTLLTQALKPDSPAIDAGDATVCAADPVKNEDQRGKSRPNDGDGDFSAVCDIGAYEADTAKPGYGSTPAKPGPIDFGNATVGATAEASFEVSETGNRVLAVANPVFDGPHAIDFSIAPTTTFPLVIPDNGAPQTVHLRCTPGAAGDRTATLTLNTDDPSNLQVSYNLICRGVAVMTPGFSAVPSAPGPIDFGGAVIGETVTQTVMLMENGTATVNVDIQSISGSHPGDFAIQSGLPVAIADGSGGAELVISCTPGAVGLRTAHLKLTTNDPANPLVGFDLVCSGNPPPVPFLAPGGAMTGLDGAYDVVVSPDMRHLYVTSYTPGAVTHFRRQPDGQLVNVATSSNDAIGGARRLALSPDARQLYVAGSGSNGLAFYQRNPDNGFLVLKEKFRDGVGADGLKGAYGVAVAPDGRHIYVAGSGESAISIFARHADETVTFQSFMSSTVQLEGVRGLAVSPDGAHLYAVGFADNQSGFVSVYSRDLMTGQLTFVQTRRQGELLSLFPAPRFMVGLAGAIDLTISPDGRFVYVAAYYDNAVVAYSRQPVGGQLALAYIYRNGVNGITGLTGATDVTLSPDGHHLFVAGGQDDAVAIFDRDGENGRLSFVEAIARDANTGEPKLDGATSVLVSPDGSTLYATAGADDAVVWFAKANPKATLDALLPASVQAGSGDLILTVKGKNFVAGAQALWDGAPISTTFASVSELQVAVPAAKVSAVGNATLTVTNPAPGGGDSHNEAVFIVTPQGANPLPSIAYINPPAVAFDVKQFTLTVIGVNFAPGAVVRWNGADRPTTFVGPTELHATIGEADIQTAFLPDEQVSAAANQPAGISVFNPPPGGGSSNLVVFTVMEPGQNPAPGITALSPASIIAQGAAGAPLVVTVQGSNFMADAQAQWNGAPRPVKWIDDGAVEVTLSAGDLALPGSGELHIVNPAPGGGASNGALFTILPLPAHPGPVASELLPGAVEAKGPNAEPVTVRVLGANFLAQSEVYFNNVLRPTTYVSASELKVTLTVTDVATAGAGNITVFSPPPGGGMSNPVVFSVIEPEQDPPPTVTGLSPSNILKQGAGSEPLVVRITGSNFKATAQAHWNGEPRPTQYINATTLEMTLSGEDLAAGGVGKITVVAPGAGTSNEISFTVWGYGTYMPLVRR